MPDNVFEDAFAELAHAASRDEAPSLQQYLVGFQVVEKNDEDTHAMGVFGYKVGDQWFFAPVFYVAGAIKGTDLMFVHGQKLFVPLDDGWVSYYLSKRPQTLGSATNHESTGSAPNFDVFTDSPDEKFAADKSFDEFIAEIKADLPTIREKVAAVVDEANPLDLATFMAAHPAQSVKLAKLISSCPEYHEAFDGVYDMAAVLRPEYAKAAAEESYKKNKRKGLISKPKAKKTKAKCAADNVVIIDAIDDPAAEFLTPDMKDEVMTGRPVVMDDRDLTSTKYKIEDSEVEAMQVDESGYYELLLEDGSTKPCYVGVTVMPLGGKAYGNVVIGDDRSAAIASPANVLAMSGSDKKFLDNAPGWHSVSKGDVFFIADGGRLVGPMLCHSKSSNSEGLPMMSVCPINMGDGYGGNALSGHMQEVRDEPEINHDNGRSWIPSSTDIDGTNECKSVVEAPKHTKAKYVGGVLYVPPMSKAIKLKLAGGDTQRRVAGIPLGDLNTVESLLIKESNDRLETFTDGRYLVLTGENGRKVLDKAAAFKHLILDWGFDKTAAAEIIDEANPHVTEYYVKRAYSFPEVDANRSFDSELGVEVESPVEEEFDIDELGGVSLLEDEEVQRAMSAAQSGKKDVFDIATMRSLVNTVDVSEVIDSYLPDMIRAMDRFGRLLFLLYWNPDDLRERYGRSDMKELEDAFRNNFKSLGEAILYLRQKTISADPIGARIELAPEE